MKLTHFTLASILGATVGAERVSSLGFFAEVAPGDYMLLSGDTYQGSSVLSYSAGTETKSTVRFTFEDGIAYTGTKVHPQYFGVVHGNYVFGPDVSPINLNWTTDSSISNAEAYSCPKEPGSNMYWITQSNMAGNSSCFKVTLFLSYKAALKALFADTDELERDAGYMGVPPSPGTSICMSSSMVPSSSSVPEPMSMVPVADKEPGLDASNMSMPVAPSKDQGGFQAVSSNTTMDLSTTEMNALASTDFNTTAPGSKTTSKSNFALAFKSKFASFSSSFKSAAFKLFGSKKKNSSKTPSMGVSNESSKKENPIAKPLINSKSTSEGESSEKPTSSQTTQKSKTSEMSTSPTTTPTSQTPTPVFSSASMSCPECVPSLVTVWKTFTDFTTYCPEKTTLTIIVCEKMCHPSTLTISTATVVTVTGICVIPETTSVVQNSGSQNTGEKESHDIQTTVKAGQGVSTPTGPTKSQDANATTSPDSKSGKSQSGAKTTDSASSSLPTKGSDKSKLKSKSISGSTSEKDVTMTLTRTSTIPKISSFVNGASRNAFGACILGFIALLF